MQGIILASLKKFVEGELSREGWLKVRADAGVSDLLYVALGQYPDQDAQKLMAAAAKEAGQAPLDFQEAFGIFLASELARMYAARFEPGWKTLDVVEHTPATIEKILRAKNPLARAPDFVVSRITPDEIQMTYTSRRRMCGMARGIIRGMAIHFGERVVVTEGTCMHKGGAACRITARRLPM